MTHDSRPAQTKYSYSYVITATKAVSTTENGIVRYSELEDIVLTTPSYKEARKEYAFRASMIDPDVFGKITFKSVSFYTGNISVIRESKSTVGLPSDIFLTGNPSYQMLPTSAFGVEVKETRTGILRKIFNLLGINQ